MELCRVCAWYHHPVVSSTSGVGVTRVHYAKLQRSHQLASIFAKSFLQSTLNWRILALLMSSLKCRFHLCKRI